MESHLSPEGVGAGAGIPSRFVPTPIIEVICTVTVKEQVSFSPGDAADAAPSESWEGEGSVGGWDQVKEMEEGGRGGGGGG